jgi:hypothetical protein
MCDIAAAQRGALVRDERLNFREGALGGLPNERCAQKARRCQNDILDR